MRIAAPVCSRLVLLFAVKQITVLIAEDHDVVREGLKALIAADPDIRIAGETDNGEAAARLARQLRPDVVLLDLAMPGGNGLEAARIISRQGPQTKVLVLSAYQDEDTVQKVLGAGVAGYMTKHSAADELLTALHQVARGETYYSPKISALLRTRKRLSFQNGCLQVKTAKLTRREQEVLGLIAIGQPNKQIAGTLSLSIKTVEKHRQAAMDKLNLHDTASLTRYAMEKGLVPGRGTTPQPQKRAVGI